MATNLYNSIYTFLMGGEFGVRCRGAGTRGLGSVNLRGNTFMNIWRGYAKRVLEPALQTAQVMITHVAWIGAWTIIIALPF